MTVLGKTKNYLLTREYLEELSDVLSEEFDFFNRDNLKISLNDRASDDLDLQDDPKLVRQELMLTSILAMIKVVERGYKFPPDEYVLV